MLKRSKNTKSETDENILLGEGEEVVEGEEGTAAGQGEGNEVVAGLQALIAEKDKEIAELKDKYLRTLADIRERPQTRPSAERKNLYVFSARIFFATCCRLSTTSNARSVRRAEAATASRSFKGSRWCCARCSTC